MKSSKNILILVGVVYFLLCCNINSSLSQDEIYNKRLELAMSKVPLEFQKHPEFLNLQLDNIPLNIELIQFRTKDQRTFVDIEGNYHTQKTGGYYNYFKDGLWLSLQEQLTFDKKFNRIGVFQSELPIWVDQSSATTNMSLIKNSTNGLAFGGNARISFLDTNLNSIGSLEKNPKLSSKDFQFDRNKLIINNYFPNIQREQNMNYWSVQTNYVIQAPISVPDGSEYIELIDKIEMDSGCSIVYEEGFFSEMGWFGSLIIKNKKGEKLGKISPAQIFDSFKSTDKNEVSKHLIPGYYVLKKTIEGYEISIRFDADFLRREDLVFPVKIDPTISNTYANNQALDDKNTQFNSNCQAVLVNTIPMNSFVVTGTRTTYLIWAKGYITQTILGTQYADKVEQRSRVGSNNNWTATQNGSGTLHDGINGVYTAETNGRQYTLSNQSIANGCYTNNSVTYQWQGYQTFFPFGFGPTNVAGCVFNYQELVTNTWEVTTTYVDLPTVSPIIDQTICAGNQTKAVTFSGTGSSYSWLNTSTSIGLAGSGSGSISSFTAMNSTNATIVATITVTPLLNGCSGIPTSFTITVNPIPTVTKPDNQILCAGENSNPITFSGTSDTEFSWTNSNVSIGLAESGSGDILSFLATNSTNSSISSTVSITPKHDGCKGITQNFTITVNPKITPKFPSFGPYCQNSVLTQVMLPTSSNDSPSITGSWNPGMLSTAVSGNITYSFTPNSGQCANPTTLTVVITPRINPEFTQIGPFCQNEIAPNLPAESQNTPSIKGAWNPNVITTSNIGTQNYVFKPNSNECANEFTMPISVYATPVPSISSSIDEGCSPLNVTFTSNAISNAEYTWTANGIPIGYGETFSHSFIDAGCYDINLIVNINGCTSDVFNDNMICVQSNPNVSFSAYPNTLENSSEIVKFLDNTIGAVSYTWDFGDSTSSTEINPLHVYNNVSNSITVTLTAVSSSGCKGNYSLTLNYREPTLLYIPNAFTPGQDEFNHTWGPEFTQGFDPYNFDLFVFNRWGEMVWESHDAKAKWDGTYGLSGMNCSEGIYTWKIGYKSLESDQKIILTGSIVLIR